MQSEHLSLAGDGKWSRRRWMAKGWKGCSITAAAPPDAVVDDDEDEEDVRSASLIRALSTLPVPSIFLSPGSSVGRADFPEHGGPQRMRTAMRWPPRPRVRGVRLGARV